MLTRVSDIVKYALRDKKTSSLTLFDQSHLSNCKECSNQLECSML